MLLQKLLAMKGVPGNFLVLGLDYEAALCPVKYVRNFILGFNLVYRQYYY